MRAESSSRTLCGSLPGAPGVSNGTQGQVRQVARNQGSRRQGSGKKRDGYPFKAILGLGVNCGLDPGADIARMTAQNLKEAAYGKLVGASALTVYRWESGRSKPRQEGMAALAAVRKLRRREALKRLEMLES